MLSKNSFGLPDLTCFSVKTLYALFLYNPSCEFLSKSCFHKSSENLHSYGNYFSPGIPLNLSVRLFGILSCSSESYWELLGHSTTQNLPVPSLLSLRDPNVKCKFLILSCTDLVPPPPLWPCQPFPFCSSDLFAVPLAWTTLAPQMSACFAPSLKVFYWEAFPDNPVCGGTHTTLPVTLNYPYGFVALHRIIIS